MPEHSHHFVLTYPAGLEKAMEMELEHLQVEFSSSKAGAIHCRGTLEEIYRCVIWSRVANRVLLPIMETPLSNPEHFYQQMRTVQWQEWMDPRGAFALQWVQGGEAEHHGQFLMYRLKDAICDHFMARYQYRPDIDKTEPDVQLFLRLTRDRATVYLDMSGGSLHRRGYRVAQGVAPLKENVAAGILYLAGWMETSEERAPVLMDPCCGSGTLLIEAARMKAGLPPRLDSTTMPVPGWPGHDVSLWRHLADDVETRYQSFPLSEKPFRLIGFDADKKVLKQAQANIEAAGLQGVIHTECREMGMLGQWPRLPEMQKQTGLIVANLPYGERLGDQEAALGLHHFIAHTMPCWFPGWQAGFLAGNRALARQMHLQEERFQAVPNGPINSVLVTGRFQKARNLGAAPATDAMMLDLARSDEMAANIPEEGIPFFNRLRKNTRRLKQWLETEHIQAYRLYDADMPEFNLAIDIYRKHVHISEYKAPRSISPEQAAHRFQVAVETLKACFSVPESHWHFKERRPQKGKSQYRTLDSRQQFMPVEEYGVTLEVNLDDYLDTGLFLDHRPVRYDIQKRAANQRFLNLFCYTGAATCHAALGGASSTTSVDMSATYLNWARRNLARNGFAVTSAPTRDIDKGRGKEQAKHRFVQADVLRWVDQCKHQYDLIFLDPPTFSNSKRMKGAFDVQTEHKALIDKLMKRLEPGGLLIFSTNARSFRLDPGLEQAYQVVNRTEESIPPDFSNNSRIHYCWYICHDR